MATGGIFVHLDARQVTEFGIRLERVGATAAARAGVAVRKTAFDIQNDAQALAPVDTGFLRGSISTSFSLSAAGALAEIGPTAYYGVFQELGTSVMAPQPYLGPAFDRRVPGLELALAQIGTEV